MPWCPKCKVEYREGFKVCNDCDCELVQVLDEDEDQPEEEIEVEDTIEDFEEALLLSVSRNSEAIIIEAKLNSFGIPTLKRFRGLDGIYGTVSSPGVDIYVPYDLLEEAKKIIDN